MPSTERVMKKDADKALEMLDALQQDTSEAGDRGGQHLQRSSWTRSRSGGRAGVAPAAWLGAADPGTVALLELHALSADCAGDVCPAVCIGAPAVNETDAWIIAVLPEPVRLGEQFGPPIPVIVGWAHRPPPPVGGPRLFFPTNSSQEPGRPGSTI
jgi:hypothetical protein